MQQTTNYGLNKPSQDDAYNIEDHNGNADIIDTELKNVSDRTQSVTESLQTHSSSKSNPHAVTKTQVGLGNVPNVTTNNQTPTYSVPSEDASLTSGETLTIAFGKIAKAVSSLIAHIANKSNPHGVTKAQVGLGNCDNTSDANKPISTAVQTALNGKAGTGVATTSANGLMSSADKTKLNGIATGAQVNTITGVKGNSETSYRTGNVNITPANIGLGNVNNTADSAKNVLSATKLTTARNISLSGQVTGSASFNGTANVSINTSYTLGSTVNNRSGYVKFSNGLLLQWGNVSITPVANEITSHPVTFPNEYAFIPVVVVNGQTSGMGSTVKGVSASDITVGGFVANIVRSNTNATTILWLAIGFSA